MKYILIALLTCFSLETFSQTQFEGKIVYNATITKEEGGGELTISFGQQALRLEFVEFKKPEKTQDIIIIRLDSGKIFTLNPSTKSFREKVLKKKSHISIPASKMIAGYSVTPVILEFMGLHELGSVFKEPVLYYANDLFYTIPEKYMANAELIMVHNGKIVLGADFSFPQYAWKDEAANDTMEGKKFVAMATAVLTQKLDPALFLIPEEYKKSSYNYGMEDSVAKMEMMMDSVNGYDTTAVMVDSAYIPTQKVVAKKNKKTPPKKKSSTKQNATRRNDE